MTAAQEKALRRVCRDYGHTFYSFDFAPAFDLPAGWFGGWIGRPGNGIYVGVSPQGEVHS